MDGSRNSSVALNAIGAARTVDNGPTTRKASVVARIENCIVFEVVEENVYGPAEGRSRKAGAAQAVKAGTAGCAGKRER